ncbi:hypothetical protein [Nitrosomonas supralitoralis]|uniref:Phage infection protein n=1 Tax=Nitrosomonas supralitoralis TaxID=2116706 RepID=A0A2P7NUE6_9PROT|nr:hypothetical protein [Nitrosomonas supralitoralis]PSJ17094.1 hypothetical protein C7H79_09765 [Nitrosomonas supralitoralis]
MKRLSIITILMFSMGSAFTSFSAEKTAEDYLESSNKMNHQLDQIRYDRSINDSNRTAHSENNKDAASITARVGQNADDREVRRI